MPELPHIDEQFHKHLTTEDELGVVVRAHIHIEASVNDFLEHVVPFPDLMPRLQYETKLRLACALGLRQDRFAALKLLGDIRNLFGHKLDAVLTDAKINELYFALPPKDQNLVVDVYNATVEQMGEKNPPPFANLTPKDRFVLIAVLLKTFV